MARYWPCEQKTAMERPTTATTWAVPSAMSPTFATAILWLTLLVPARRCLYSTVMAKLEIELKFPAPAGIAAKIVALGARPGSRHVERDHYFNAPDRDFAATNEAFRIRRSGNESRLTYKGPRLAGPAKT